MSFGSRFGIFLLSWLGSLGATAVAGLLLFDTLDLGFLGDEPGPRAAVIGALVLVTASLSLLVARLARGGRAHEPAILAVTSAAWKFSQGDLSARAPGDDEIEAAFNAAANAAAARISLAEADLNEHAEELTAAVSELRENEEGKRRDLKMSGRIQRRVVPRVDELPMRAEIAFNALYAPAENTGGDLFDVMRAGKNGYALLAADVSGRGIAVALLSALVKNAFRSRASWVLDPAEVLAEINSELVPLIGGSENFVTAFFGFLNLETGKLSYAVAGHPASMHLHRRLGSVDNLDGEDPALGVIVDAEFHSKEVCLEEGDRLLLFTDGVTGARNYKGEILGRERLSSVFSRGCNIALSELPAAIVAEIEAFTIGCPHADDIVALACEFRSFARDEGPGRRMLPETDDYRTLARRGAELAAAGKTEEAIRVYERVLALEPGDAKALNNIGTLLWRMGRKELAAERFREAASLDPNDPRITRNLELVARRPSRQKSV